MKNLRLQGVTTVVKVGVMHNPKLSHKLVYFQLIDMNSWHISPMPLGFCFLLIHKPCFPVNMKRSKEANICLKGNPQTCTANMTMGRKTNAHKCKVTATENQPDEHSHTSQK